MFSSLYNEAMEKPVLGLSVGERISRMREGRNWSLRKLAERSGVSHAYISQLEHGLIDRPGAEHLSNLANALEVTLDELLGETEPIPIGKNQGDWRTDLLMKEAPNITYAEARRWIVLLDSLPPNIREDFFKMGEHLEENERPRKRRRKQTVSEIQAAYHVDALDKDDQQQRAEG